MKVALLVAGSEEAEVTAKVANVEAAVMVEAAGLEVEATVVE